LTIFGRGLINKFEVVVHQLYLCMKMPAVKGVITVRGNQQLARDIEQGVPQVKKMYMWSKLKSNLRCSRNQEEVRKNKISKKNVKQKGYPLDKHLPHIEVTISATLDPKEEQSLLEFLNKNQDVFAWSACDLHGVSRDIIEHRIDIDLKIKSKRH
jgi:hypothetical protein